MPPTPEIDEVYAELRKIAAIHLSRSVRKPSLQATQLVHEAWLRLEGRGWRSKTHFLAIASRTMRMLLIDAVRARMAEQRAAEEEQVRLETLNQALADIHADKSRFLAAASHDLRQPVHAIGLFADTLVAHVPPGDAHDMVTRIQQSMRAMNGMLSELLDLSSLNAGTTRATVSAVPLTRVLLHIDNEFAQVAEARGVDHGVRSREFGARQGKTDCGPGVYPADARD